jgi:hypothetical protein
MGCLVVPSIFFEGGENSGRGSHCDFINDGGGGIYNMYKGGSKWNPKGKKEKMKTNVLSNLF